jgi:hypothetical protein
MRKDTENTLGAGAFLLALMVSWAAACAVAWSGDMTPLSVKLGDTDDALRLVQVRQFLAGASWFDLHLDRLQPPEGYDSHWSRLIDVGLASIYLAAKPFVGGDRAEIAMRFLWPLLSLIPAMAAVASAAGQIGGKKAALIAFAFAATGLIAFQQFRPGRIDHHNIQVALALVGVAALMASVTSARAAALAGAVTGGMLVIGLESIHFTVFFLTAASLLYVTGHTGKAQTRAFWASLAAAAAAGFFLSVPPAKWLEAPCDAYAGNFALGLVVPAVLILAVEHIRPPGTAAGRFLLAALAGIGALAVFAAFDPVCLSGPFARMNPALRPLWLDHVSENRSVLGLLRDGNLFAFAGMMGHPTVGLLAGLWLLNRRRGAVTVIAVAALALGIAMQLVALKTFSYPAWLAVAPAAAVAAAAFDAVKHRMFTLAALAAAAFSPAAMALGSAVLLTSIPGSTGKTHGRPEACLATANYARLANLPPGRVLAPIDLGPSILALTPHLVPSAPYHRLQTGMTDAAEIYRDMAKSEPTARRLELTYLVDCDNDTSPETVGWLLEALRTGARPPWLEPVPGSQKEPLRLWRFRFSPAP